MDNITHSLTGLALARAGLNRLCPRATLLLILSANAPDADIVSLAGGQLKHLEIHRGYTHSLIGLPFMAALSVLVVAAIFRHKLPWARAFLLCCLGVASHLLLDWTNAYGVRLLLPFSSTWFHSDLNSLFDLYILAALLLAALWPSFSRLVSREIGSQAPAGRGIAVSALAFFLFFDAARAALHARAIAQLQSRLYEDQPPLRTAALPDPFTPARWRAVVETTNTYRLLAVDSFSDLIPQGGQIFFKPATQPSFQSASEMEAFRFFLYFARFPVWSQEPVTGDQGPETRVDLVDLRFGVPGAGSLHCIALENSRYQVLGSWFTYGSGVQLGWNRGPN
ncbi:MAG TPA: metal-dependent hydrolase [Bryobacteraceae bacterium]|jgi:inner membrane protein|nr:metal-dependent hydrolase [Bryobacteraceae bacterium]